MIVLWFLKLSKLYRHRRNGKRNARACTVMPWQPHNSSLPDVAIVIRYSQQECLGMYHRSFPESLLATITPKTNVKKSQANTRRHAISVGCCTWWTFCMYVWCCQWQLTSFNHAESFLLPRFQNLPARMYGYHDLVDNDGRFPVYSLYADHAHLQFAY